MVPAARPNPYEAIRLSKNGRAGRHMETVSGLSMSEGGSYRAKRADTLTRSGSEKIRRINRTEYLSNGKQSNNRYILGLK